MWREHPELYMFLGKAIPVILVIITVIIGALFICIVYKKFINVDDDDIEDIEDFDDFDDFFEDT